LGITSSPSFCILPWIQLYLHPDGRGALCCAAPKSLPADEGDLSIHTSTLRGIWNSAALKDARRRMAAGERISNCDGCWQSEKFSGESLRTMWNARWLNPELREAIDAAQDFEALSDPLYLDLRLGNICNLKCTICKPLYSSQIERDPVHARWAPYPPHREPNSRFGKTEWSEAPELLDEIADLSGNVSCIYLAGSEPTINRTYLAWAERLADEGRAARIDLIMTTNLTNASQQFLAMLSKFRSVEMWVSVDGYDAVYEYVRYPARWRSLVANLGKVRAARPDMDLHVACVLQALNLASIADLIAWASQPDVRLPVGLNIGRSLEHYNDVRILPPDYRAIERARIDAAIRGAPNEAELAAKMASMFDEIDAEDFSDEARRDSATGLMQFVNDMDRSRRLSYRTVAPQTCAAIADYAGGWDERGRYS
jgi:MoaA/NifB/PqqE/SkfB family radical SAM enzyme